METALPTKFGKYDVVGVLGKGAMGIVYDCRDPVIGRRVAIKTVLKESLDSSEAEGLLGRFKQEAQAAGRLNHPGVVSIYDYGETEDFAYIAMEYISGKELKQYFDAGEKYSIPEIVRIMCDILDALDHAHRNKVVHRDIKPANIMITDDGRVKVADFGVAKIESSLATQIGTRVGTPAYMSPEQHRMLSVDGRSDLFSCGVILYYFLTGSRPFTGGSHTIAQQILTHTPIPPSEVNVALPVIWDAIVRKALAKRRDERFSTARDFIEALQHGLNPSPGSVNWIEWRPPDSPRDTTSRYARESDANASRRGTAGSASERPDTHMESELEFWKEIKDSDNADDFAAFVDSFPDGRFSHLAQRRLDKLKAANDRKQPDGTALRSKAVDPAAAEAQAQARRAESAPAEQEAKQPGSAAAEARARSAIEEREAKKRWRNEAEGIVRRSEQERDELEAKRRISYEAEKREQAVVQREAERVAAEKARMEQQEKAKREAEDLRQREIQTQARREAEARVRREAEAAAKQAEEKQAEQKPAEQKRNGDTRLFIHGVVLPEKLGKIELRQPLSRYGEAKLFVEGYDEVEHRTVAVKIVPTTGLDQRAIDDFHKEHQREMIVAAQLKHANIVAIQNYGDQVGFKYVVMEYVVGQHLGQMLASDRQYPLTEAVPLVTMMLAAIQFAHERGVVHRNLQPSNILVSDERKVKILDFGIAQIETSEHTQVLHVASATHTAPEIYRGEDADARSDIFSIGVILYQLLTGKLPFSGSPIAVREKVLKHDPVAPRTINPNLPPEIDGIVARALAKSRGNRFRTALEFSEALNGLASRVESRSTGKMLGGRYSLGNIVGKGRSAKVYEAYDTHLEVTVAIKLQSELGPDRDFLNESELLTRFKTEAKLLREFDHKNIVKVYDFGEWDHRPYIVMNYVEGGTLSDAMRDQRKLALLDALGIACGLLEGLQYAHERNVIHRDIKPTNILLAAKDQRPVLVDFGIAKVAESGLTNHPAALGTPRYMAPEQCSDATGGAIDGRADIYSTGIVLYEMVTGVHPFNGRHEDAWHVGAFAPPRTPSQLDASIPAMFDQALLKALSSDPNERYRTANEFREALAAIAA